jgi:hypothetical protein
MFSLLDGFSGYNQGSCSRTDRLKTTFRTKWGTFTYRRMPFGLINVGKTFQREMDIAFKGLIGQSVVIYLDDVTVYSKKRVDHPHHLKQIFERCRKYGISLNPRRASLLFQKENCWGISFLNMGSSINPECTKAIMQIPFPNNKKSMQSFFGKINFV